MSRIVFKNLDGSVGIIVPAENTTLTVEAIAEKDVPSGLSYRITDESNIPVDRTFRAAWTDDNPTETVDVDMSKARDIHMSTLREKRDKKLLALDIEQLQGANVAARKQALRDMPKNIDLTTSSTPEDLKEYTPLVLK